MTACVPKPLALSLQAERFAGLEWLRFGLAMLLVLYHTLPFYPGYTEWPVTSTIVEMGFFSTRTFFALSGFLLAHVYLRNDRLKNPKDFLFKRFANLYPIHIMSLVFAVALIVVTSFVDSKTQLNVGYRSNEFLERINPELLRYVMSDTEFWLNWFLQLTSLQAWNPIFLAYNGPAWSISALFFFYAIFPFIGPRLAKVERKWIPMMIVVAIAPLPAVYVVATQAYADDVLMGALQHVPIFQLPAFIGGVITYLVYAEFRERGLHVSPRGKVILWTLCFIVLACASILNWYHDIAWHMLIRNGMLLPVVMTVMVLSASSNVRDSKLARRLGAASLSIFALHIPLFVLFRRAEMVLFIDFELCYTDVHACVQSARSHELQLWLYPLLVLLTVVLSVLFQEHIVVPIRDWMLKLYQGRKST